MILNATFCILSMSWDCFWVRLELKFLGPQKIFRFTFMGVAKLFYFTNIFRCLFKKRRNEDFENFPLWKIYLIKLVKWTTHFNCWSKFQRVVTFDSKVRFSQFFFLNWSIFREETEGVWKVFGGCLEGLWKVSGSHNVSKLVNCWGGIFGVDWWFYALS